MKIAICASQVDFDAVAKLLNNGWKIATGIKNNGITGTDTAIIYHLIQYTEAEADKAAQFLQVEKADVALASGVHDIEAMNFFDAAEVPAKITDGWIPLSKDHVYAKGAWLIRCKPATVQAVPAPATPTPTGAGQ